MAETVEQIATERRSLHITRLRIWGRASVVVVLPPELRAELGVVVNEAIGFRVKVIQGRRFLIGEKIPLNALARLPELPADVLRKGDRR